MTSTEFFDVFSVAIFLIFFVSFWILTNSFRKRNKLRDPQLKFHRPESLRSLLKAIVLIISWYQDKSISKIPFIEQIYCGSEFTDLISWGKPKLIKLFKICIFITDDDESIKNVLLSQDCSVKLPPTLADILSNGHCRGLLWNDGPNWKELRKYSVKKLGQLGFRKKDKLSLILSELLPDLLAHLECLKINTNNKVPTKNLFMLPVINVVWCIIGGHKFSINDKKFSALHKHINTMTNLPLWKCHLINFLPKSRIITRIFGYKPFYDSIKNVNEYIEGFVNDKIKRNRNVQLEPEDFVDHFLLEIEKHKDDEDLKHIYCKEQLIAILVDLFAAGMDTTSKFLEFSLMYMILYPEIQKKVQEEIDLVVGKNSLPSYGDHKNSMPFTIATMMEIHRMSSVVPVITRYIEKDWNISGRVLQKGTQIANVMWALRMDKKYWGDDASIFRPERFLNEDNTFITSRMDHVLPFGAGVRICPGESVSSASSFMLFVGILQRFTLTKAIEDEPLGIDKSFGLVTQTLPFHISLNSRTEIVSFNS